MKVVGNKSTFAIQYRVDKMLGGVPFGSIILWINDVFVGDWNDVDYLINMPYKLTNSMARIMRSKQSYFFWKSPEWIAKTVLEHGMHGYDKEIDFDTDANVVWMNSPVFDGFMIFAYHLGGQEVCFLTQLIDEYLMEQMPAYPRGVQKATINLDHFHKTVDDFETQIRALLPPSPGE
jgi:Immunity protein 42